MDERKEPPPLFPHQEEGIEYLRGPGDRALFDEQGLGKTRQLIAAMQLDILDGVVEGALVVCPNILKSTWKTEVEKYSSLKVAVFENDPTGRRRAYLQLRARFYVINYEAVPIEIDNLKRLLRFRRLALILDESQRIKNPEAKITLSLLHLRELSAKRVIVTGTPIANRPEDLWSQLQFVDAGAILGESLAGFKRRLAGRTYQESLHELRQIIDTVGLRRRKEDVLELPPKHYVDHPVRLTGLQADMYRTLRDELYLWIEDLGGDQLLEQADHILTRMLRLAQLASNPRLIDAGYSEDPAKFLELDGIIARLLEGKAEQKVIIWSAFVANVDELTVRYAAYGAVAIHGRIPDQTRAYNLARFHSDAKVQVLVANPAAAREGLTLTEANVAIYVDRSFNLVDYLQSQDRIHRISQTRDCYIINLIAQDTVDEFVAYLLESKREVARYLQGDTPQLPNMEADLVRHELLHALL